MKIVILSNQTRSMAIFWRVLIGLLLEQKMEVLCAAPPGDEKSDAALAAMGARVIHYPLDRKGINPLRDLESFLSLKKIFHAEKPDLLFATTIKPVIYGCMAARAAGVPGIYATITGLGYAFEKDNFIKKIIGKISAALYRQSLRHANGIFFQNRDDYQIFIDSGILQAKAPVFFARGTGVDTSFFAPAPFPPLPPAGELTFLLVARLLEAKGLAEYASAASLLKKSWPDARFQLLGPMEQGRGAVSPQQLETWRKDGCIEYLGESKDVRPFIANSHVAVLPSWREGTPTSIMEAMSMGRPCVVTDVPGCREVVKNGVNGWLCMKGNPESLALCMEKFLRNPESVEPMGKKSREMAVNTFNATVVAKGIIADMRKAFPDKKAWPEAPGHD